MFILVLLATILAVSLVLTLTMRADMAEAREDGRTVLSLRDCLRR